MHDEGKPAAHCKTHLGKVAKDSPNISFLSESASLMLWMVPESACQFAGRYLYGMLL